MIIFFIVIIGLYNLKSLINVGVVMCVVGCYNVI